MLPQIIFKHLFFFWGGGSYPHFSERVKNTFNERMMGTIETDVTGSSYLTSSFMQLI